MNLDWVFPNTVYLTLGGSRAYGLSNEMSDVDVKGICMPPPEVDHHLFETFEQATNLPDVEESYERLKNPQNPEFESTIYSLRKYFLLAQKVNPNIVEMLFTDPADRLIHCNSISDILMENRELFLSTKAKFTFSGYAYAQLKQINRHRKWIVKGEVPEPKREDFGLPTPFPAGLDDLLGSIKSKVEKWNFNHYELDEMDRKDLKEDVWELVFELSGHSVGWDNWPDKYAHGVIEKMRRDFNLKDEVVSLIHRERAFDKAMVDYKSWLSWKAKRNPKRRQLEVESGYDTKHASHLVRLMRMGYEIMTTGKVIVKRPDWEELLAIKNGAWDYDQVVEYADMMQKKLDEVYPTSKLPREVDKEKVNRLYQELCEEYWG